MAAVVFHELLGFRGEDAAKLMQEATARLQSEPASDLVRHTLAPHAAYSVSPALFGLIRARLEQDPFSKSSVHLGESLAEIELLKYGTGPCRAALERLGKWDSSWVFPQSGPVEYLDSMGFLYDGVLAVHGVHLGAADLTRLAALGVTLVTCPRGNLRTGAGVPPIEEFFSHGVRVAVGTDSLASVPDLNLFSEVAEMRRLARALPARILLESATISGARALGFDADFGTIDSGKRDALVTVQLDGAVPSVEEYLVSGVDASQISWVPES
jgi:cytosine/adenosine deaminase-related metal-dependent hydrolase